MVKALVQRIIVLSAVTAALYACLPEKGIGKFAKGVIELIKLLLIIMPIMEKLI